MSTLKKIILEKNSEIAEICSALMLFALFLILLIGSVSAVSTETKTFSEASQEIREPLPNGDWTAYCADSAIATHFCILRGYDGYTGTYVSNYIGPRLDNDHVFKWNGSSFVDVLGLGCANVIDLITCTRQIECSLNSDCDDDNLYTEDNCINPGQVSSYCDYKTIRCINNIDCGSTGFTGKEFCSDNDVFKNYKESKCIDAGRTSSYCTETITPTFLIDCGETSCGNYGNNYCKDNNVYHSRVCNDKGCSVGACYSTLSVDEKIVETCNNGCANGVCNPQPPECTKDSDCGAKQICSNNNCVDIICKTDSECNDNNAHTEDKCLNPGTTSSICQHNNIICLTNAECGTNDYLNQLFCKNNNVFDKYITYTCNAPGTALSSCTNSICDKQKSECANGCANGQCNEEPEPEPECTSDSDCHARSPSQKYCKDGNVYQDVYEPACDNKCSYDSTPELVKTCKNGCISGLCIETIPAPRDEDSYGGAILEDKGDNIINLGAYVTPSSSTDYSFINETVKAIPLAQDNVQVTTNYNSLWIILLIILIVIFLVILIVLFNL